MSNLFSELDQLGLSKLTNLEIYELKEMLPEEIIAAQVKEYDLIFDKGYVCPVCDKEFRTKAVKTGKARLLSTDTDLRPKYAHIDPIKYDVIVCPICGYASLNRFFSYITTVQSKWIKEQISSNFQGFSEHIDIYDYDEALKRYKLALINTIVKKGKTSEKAYTCLKIAWLLRGKSEELADNEKAKKIKAEIEKQELEFIKKAFIGFEQAFSKEMFPMCGMDEMTATYLVADLARRCGKDEDALRWISRVITSRTANDRIKDKAREIKDLIKTIPEES